MRGCVAGNEAKSNDQTNCLLLSSSITYAFGIEYLWYEPNGTKAHGTNEG